MNLTYANCREHGRTLFGKRPRRKVMTCMICDRQVSVDEADINVTKRRRPRHEKVVTGELFAGTGAADRP